MPQKFFFIELLIYIYGMEIITQSKKKSGGKILLLIGALVCGGLYYRSKKVLIKSVNFSFERLQINWKKIQIIVTMGISNPTESSQTVSSIVGNLSLAGSNIASVESFVPVQIKPKAKSTVQLIIKPSLMGIVSQLKNIIQSKGKDIKKLQAKFVGAANLGGTTLPIDIMLT